ncbi:Oidioi.mRNA.OKI2018_I69.chr2.g6736.t1.cds [Oikopleura dioica]|uniref:Oidioi.mRNA.OKI2018_I69.chr2.g6736.t1.cds n=1 Tax=Oikopleura dioica TaxID=34765 RepID=A0ABN7T7S0_OIKDI|nr:Oidioi.mRNA.OKI2018_I69.chr2.g6736.t1.cds [Oikopleura dioica]
MAKTEKYVDFRKIMMAETGLKPYTSRISSAIPEIKKSTTFTTSYSIPQEGSLSRISSSEGTFSVTSFPSIDSCASSVSSDDNSPHVRGILKTGKKCTKMHKRSLLHSFERPRRNIDSFVKNILNAPSPKDSGVSEGSSSEEENDRRGRSKNGRNRTATHSVESMSRKFRSFSLDRDRLTKNSMSTFCPDKFCDNRSQTSSDEKISVKSDLLGYRGDLKVGPRTAPSKRKQTHIHLSNRYGNLLREFDRNQKSTVRRVENIFDKCHRDISLALIDMKIDLAYSTFKTR